MKTLLHSFLLILFYWMAIQPLSATTDKYRVIIRDDPSTSMVIGWNQVNGNSPIVYYDVVDHGTNYQNYANSRGADRTVGSQGMDNRFARLANLQPNTVYYFVIRDDNSTSARFSFKTVPNVPTEKLSLIAGGDSRNNRTPRQNANRLVARLRAHAVLFGGDMTDNNTSGEWQDWMDDWQLTIAPDGRMTPIIAARGNHEYTSSVIYNLFDVPTSDAYFANTFGGSLFRAYTLNSNIATGGSQKSWLQTDLQNNSTVSWKAAQYHHPIRPHVGSKAERNDIYSDWLPSFEQHGVDFVVECDAHTVKSTYPIHSANGPGSEEGFIRDDLDGIVYVGEGCWGAPLRGNDDGKNWTRSRGSFNQFKLIHITLNRIEIRTIKTDNASSVGYNADSNYCDLPANIDIWNPAEGDVVVIENFDRPGRPNISLVNPLNGQSFTNLNTIPLIASAIDTDGGSVDSVSFYINGEYVGSATSATSSFQLNWTPTGEGVYEIYAKAYDNDLKMERTANAFITIYSTNTVVETQVIQSSDDAEEYTNGTVDLSSTDLELTDDTGLNQLNQKIGIRFANLAIPQGATILNAYIQFETDEVDATLTTLDIRVEDDVSPATYGGNLSVSSRPLAAAGVSWVPAGWNTIGQAAAAQQTPNLAILVQSIVNKTGWVNGNPIAFVITGSGRRVASSFDGATAPKLIVEYSIGNNTYPGNLNVQVNSSDDDAEESWLGVTSTSSSDLELVNDGGDQTVGIRFTNIDIPRGATILSAFIQFTVDEANSTGTSLTIKIEDHVNASNFSALSFNEISSRNTLTPTVSWAPSPWTILDATDNNQRTPDLSALVQAMVNKSNWLSGGPMVFIIDGNGERTAYAYDRDPARAPMLIINYQVSFPPINYTPLPDVVLCQGTSVDIIANGNYSAYFWGNDVSPGQPSTLTVSNPGTYYLRVMDANGQVARDTIEVTTESVLADLGPDQQYAGTPITLSPNPVGGPFASYSWSTGAITPSITVNAAGSYRVTVSSPSGCTSSDEVVISPVTGVEALPQVEVNCFPNPAGEQVQLLWKQAPAHAYDVLLTGVDGKTWKHLQQRSDSNLQISLNNIPIGQYYLRISIADKLLKTIPLQVLR